MRNLILILMLALLLSSCSRSLQGDTPPFKKISEHENPTVEDDIDLNNRAVMNNDISLCDKISDEEFKKQCRSYILGDFDLCSDFENEDSINADKDYCIINAAIMNGPDSSILDKCDEIEFIDNAIKCRAILLEDLGECENISNKFMIGSCMNDVAFASGDIGICDGFDFDMLEYAEDVRNSCYKGIARKTKDSTACDRIEDDFNRELCLKLV